MALTDRLGEAAVEEQVTDEFVTLINQSGGLPRIAARIFFALLTAEEPYLSGPELAARLEISSGSVSTMTRLLEANGMIERFCRPKVRADLFRVSLDHWRATLRRAAELSRRYQELSTKLEQVVESDAARRRIDLFASLQGYLADTLFEALETWNPGDSDS